jgi:hypothetical protein
MYPTRGTIETLAKKLRLPLPDQFSQDWEYEVADSTKVSEWLNVYSSSELDVEEKCLLMKLRIA